MNTGEQSVYSIQQVIEKLKQWLLFLTTTELCWAYYYC
jgi:hypothetical protein